LNDPEHIKQVLMSNRDNYVKGVGFERVEMLLGHGIIVSDGAFWRRQRTLIQPGFSRANVARLAVGIKNCTLNLRDQWRQLPAGAAVDVTTAMSEYALEVILRAILSEDLDRLVEQQGHNPFAFLTEDMNRDLKVAFRFRQLRQVMLACIRERRQSGHRPFDFLSLMLDARDKRSGEAMNDEELLDEMATLIIAGHETTAGTLNFAWYLLSRNPDVQDRALAEVLQTTGDDDFDFDTLMSLEYVPQVLRETLRLYPPVWLFSRRAVAADQIAGFDVAPGTHIFLAPYVLHRREDLWPDPERFDPDRFAPGQSEQRHPCAFIPFSAGARRCIGEYFSFVEMQTHLAVMMKDFQLKYQDSGPVELDPAINLRSRHNLEMVLSTRAMQSRP
jgi:cytochrome P450